jgi:hypothetical protein
MGNPRVCGPQIADGKGGCHARFSANKLNEYLIAAQAGCEAGG